MRRRTFDALASIAGLLLAAVLLAGGGLLLWGHSFVNGQVHSQLAAQKIVFPGTGSPEFKALPAADASAMRPYAGQLMATGAQAHAYADHFIAVHLREMSGGKTYSQLSAAALAQPRNTKLAGLVQTVFRGTTLRSMLLNAYAFWQMGQIMLIAAIVAFTGAGLLLILSALGFAHVRRAAPEAEILPRTATRVQPAAS
ncbi:MAG TPA: hypothetical protein VE343_09060 [Streptosporangiaceae bacterium]|nr:hypothetical protein [Streptosporangiaceae bacterium]